MSRKPTSASPPKPSRSKEDRLKAALKANLQRRKTQSLARSNNNENEKAG